MAAVVGGGGGETGRGVGSGAEGRCWRGVGSEARIEPRKAFKQAVGHAPMCEVRSDRPCGARGPAGRKDGRRGVRQACPYRSGTCQALPSTQISTQTLLIRAERQRALLTSSIWAEILLPYCIGPQKGSIAAPRRRVLVSVKGEMLPLPLTFQPGALMQQLLSWGERPQSRTIGSCDAWK